MSLEIGHRILEVGDDAVIEAAAPTRLGCVAELVRGFVATFANTRNVPPSFELDVDVIESDGVNLVVRLLGDVCSLLELRGEVVVDVEVEEDPVDGHIYGTLFTAPIAATTATGCVPKPVTRSDVTLSEDQGSWRGRVVVM